MNDPSNAAERTPQSCVVSSEEFVAFVASNRKRVEAALAESLPSSMAAGTERFNRALRDAVFPGGKRLRPHLTLIGSALGGATDEQALSLACAVEFIHTSSLILDDLPSMDDAELRRDRPTLHVVYGEGLAILVAVTLLNQAYALLAASARDAAGAARLPALVREAASCIGSSGMIAGQAAELAQSGEPVEPNELPSRDLKTTALMRLMMVAGGIIAGAPDGDVAALATFGESLGRAFQIYDDLADTLGDRQSTGKSVGQDLRHQRPTAVDGLSHDEARKLAADNLAAAVGALNCFDGRPCAKLLRSAAEHILAGFKPGASHASPSV